MTKQPSHNLRMRIDPRLLAALKVEAALHKRTMTATLEIILSDALAERLATLNTLVKEEPK